VTVTPSRWRRRRAAARAGVVDRHRRCGAGVAGFGVGIEKMMFGPPLVMLALGGMTLALCGIALWRVIDP